jgi:pSer/pThr/pTyr-binding forkhead associated (FHA) protein
MGKLSYTSATTLWNTNSTRECDMPAKLLIDIPTMNWAYTVLLEPGQEYSFGSAKGNFVSLPSYVASERHALITWHDAWLVEDLGSKLGTFVNNEPVTSPRPLTDKDILKIGTCEAVFQNPEAKAGQAELEHTKRVAAEQQSHLQNVLKPAAGQAGEPSDMVWVAQTLASIVQEVSANPGSRDEAYAVMLRHLREAIQADNGFVMIPDNLNMRWIIRAWVGDSSQWTQYEKSHPLPLTVTNRAYRMMQVVSNALGDAKTPSDDQPITSMSLEQLQVSSYIAVPLLEKGQKKGVLYFDTRAKDRKFRQRDVQLLEMAGTVILQIEAMG